LREQQYLSDGFVMIRAAACCWLSSVSLCCSPSLANASRTNQ